MSSAPKSVICRPKSRNIGPGKPRSAARQAPALNLGGVPSPIHLTGVREKITAVAPPRPASAKIPKTSRQSASYAPMSASVMTESLETSAREPVSRRSSPPTSPRRREKGAETGVDFGRGLAPPLAPGAGSVQGGALGYWRTHSPIFAGRPQRRPPWALRLSEDAPKT
jgi:hypothetical protein